MDDVQRFFILLKTLPVTQTAASQSTDSGSTLPKKELYRLIRIGKKKLPSAHDGDRFWGIVEEVTEDLSRINVIFHTSHYATVSQGDRTLEPCRPVGEGAYALVHNKNQTFLAYLLEIPHGIGEVQKALNIDVQGNMELNIKNPGILDQPGIPMNLKAQPSNVNTPQSPLKVEYPAKLQESFQGRRWAPAVPKELLNYKGVELLLAGSTSEKFEVLADEIGISDDFSTLDDDSLFEELSLSKKEHPIDPLVKGEWK